MYQRIDVHRKIKPFTTTTFLLNCIIGLIILLILSVVVIALLPLYLPFHNFIPTNLNNNIQPNRSTVLIDENNWPIMEQTTENLLKLKLDTIQFTNISDVRLVDSKNLSTTWCNPNGCLRIFGQIKFPLDCSLVCQLRKLNKIAISNLIEPSIKINLNSTLNISYNIDIDLFTIVIHEENGDQIKMFLLYNLTESQVRLLSSMSFSVDNSSLVNITHLINNSIIQSQMNIYKFNVIQADVDMNLSILNVTILVQFMTKCFSNCQEIEINKLKNMISKIHESIVIGYNGNIYLHNVSLTGVFLDTSSVTPTYTTIPDNSTIEITSSLIIYLTESIFQVDYRLESIDLLIDGDFALGPITDYSTLNDLTNMMQTTVSNYTNITVIVYNATIDHENSTINSMNYILRLVVYYIYPITCDKCMEISNNAVYNEPQLNELIQIRNASLLDIDSPIIVINITPNLSSIYTAPTSTVQYSTDNTKTTNSRLSSPTTQHPIITEHTSTILHSTGHSTLHTADHTTLHSTEHTTHHSTEHTTHHTTTHPHTSTHP